MIDATLQLNFLTLLYRKQSALFLIFFYNNHHSTKTTVYSTVVYYNKYSTHYIASLYHNWLFFILLLLFLSLFLLLHALWCVRINATYLFTYVYRGFSIQNIPEVIGVFSRNFEVGMGKRKVD